MDYQTVLTAKKQSFDSLKETERYYLLAIRNYQNLLTDYAYYKRFFRSTDGDRFLELAEYRYASSMFRNTGTLVVKMAQNKQQRKDLLEQITALKQQLIRISQEHAKNMTAFKSYYRAQEYTLMTDLEEAFQIKGLEVLAVVTNRFFKVGDEINVRAKVSFIKGQLVVTKELHNDKLVIELYTNKRHLNCGTLSEAIHRIEVAINGH